MSLYGDYIKERENKNIVENENGFATYYFLPQGVYLENLYVKPSARGKFESAKLAEQVVAIAKEKGCTKMYTTIKPSTNGSTEALKLNLWYGFRLDFTEHNAIILVKDI